MNPYSPPGPSYPDVSPGYGAATSAPGGVSDLAVDLLRQTRPWVMFLGVLCFIGSAFMLIVAVGVLGLGAFAPKTEDTPFSPALLGVIYLPLAALYIYPGIKLWKYGTAIGRLLTSKSTADLEAALKEQKSLWKFNGIAAIVLMAVYFLAFVGILALGVSKGLGKG